MRPVTSGRAGAQQGQKRDKSDASIHGLISQSQPPMFLNLACNLAKCNVADLATCRGRAAKNACLSSQSETFIIDQIRACVRRATGNGITDPAHLIYIDLASSARTTHRMALRMLMNAPAYGEVDIVPTFARTGSFKKSIMDCTVPRSMPVPRYLGMCHPTKSQFSKAREEGIPISCWSSGRTGMNGMSNASLPLRMPTLTWRHR